MSKGRYGEFGGQYVPETLMNEIIKLEEAYEYYKNDADFNAELNKLLNEYAVAELCRCAVYHYYHRRFNGRCYCL